MPFKSRKQEQACYATKGFHGKVDCKEWSDKTDHKKLPEKALKSIGEHGAKHAKKKK